MAIDVPAQAAARTAVMDVLRGLVCRMLDHPGRLLIRACHEVPHSRRDDC